MKVKFYITLNSEMHINTTFKKTLAKYFKPDIFTRRSVLLPVDWDRNGLPFTKRLCHVETRRDLFFLSIELGWMMHVVLDGGALSIDAYDASQGGKRVFQNPHLTPVWFVRKCFTAQLRIDMTTCGISI